MNPITEPAVNAAITRALGQVAPFRDEEVASLRGSLTVQGAQDLRDTARLQSLEELTLFACNTPDWNFLPALHSLRTLRLIACPIRDGSILSACPNLERLDLAFTLIEDLPELQVFERLREIRCTGTPLDDANWGRLGPALREADMVIGLSSEEDWRLTRELAHMAQPACFGVFGLKPLLVRPGTPKMPNADCDYTVAPRELLEAMRNQPEFSLDWFFTLMGVGARGKDSPHHSLDASEHIAIGYRDQAREWLQETHLPGQEIALLNRFLDNFPKALFYKEDSTFVHQAAERHHVELPGWFVDLRKTFAFVMPYHDFVEVQFNRRQLQLIFGEQRDAWFSLGLRGIDNEGQRPILEINRCFPIGAKTPEGDQVLAISLDSQDRMIYTYSLEDQAVDGSLPPDAIRPCATSYGDLLSSIVALRLNGRNIVHAPSEGHT
jgi:hypothetical protein